MNILKNLNEFKKFTTSDEKQQIMEIDLINIEENL